MSRSDMVDHMTSARWGRFAPCMSTLRRAPTRLSVSAVLRWGLFCQFSVAVVVCYAAADGGIANRHGISLLVTVLGASLAGSLLYLGIGAPVAHRDAAWTRRRDDARHQCTLAMENMRDGLCHVDRTQRLVRATSRYTMLYRLPQGSAGPGMQFREMVDLIYAGTAAPKMDKPGYLAWHSRLAAHGKPIDRVFDLVDGRMIGVYHQPLPDGGWVTTHQEIMDRPHVGSATASMANLAPLRSTCNQAPLRAALDLARQEGDSAVILCLQSELRRALANDGFRLSYQPMVDLRSGLVIGLEALLCWREPQRGVTLPAAFMRVAEATGLMVPLGAWALRRATADAARWPKDLRVIVNLSPAQFGPHLTQTVCAALQSSGLSPGRLELDVTEATLWEPTGDAIATLLELRAIGIRIALDDFGGGNSSLASLARFPFDKIKIDPSFARSAVTDPHATADVRTMRKLAHDAGIRVAAAGVETAEHLHWLRQEGFDEAQGYLFGAPRSAEELDRMCDVSDVALPPGGTVDFLVPAAFLPSGHRRR